MSQSTRRAWGSRPVVGSSRSSTLGSCMRARAIMTRCCRPPERVSGLASALSAICSSSSRRSARASRSARGEAEVAPVIGQHLAHGEVAVEVAVLGHDRDPPLGRRAARRPRRRRPRRCGRSSGARGVVMQPRVVLLPAPFGPRRPKNSPAATENEMPAHRLDGGRLAPVPGYVLTRFSTTSMGWDGRGTIDLSDPSTAARARGRATRTPSRTTTRPFFTTGLNGGYPDAHEVEEPRRSAGRRGRPASPTSRLPTSASRPSE